MSTPKTVAFHTLGCKLNFTETSSLAKLFENAGYQPIEFEDIADIYVINTCSVTEFADSKCRHAVRYALRSNPRAHIIVVGCYAQLKPKEIAEIEGVDLVLGAAEKFRILDFIDQIESAQTKGLVFAGSITEVNTFTEAISFGDRTRAFLKIQDGCDYKCTFCTIPLARGKSRSDSVDNIVKNAESLASKGIKEIVLTGVNVGDFGNGTEVIEGKTSKKQAILLDLLVALETKTSIQRYRIGSIEPNLVTDDIIAFIGASKKFVPHFHMPLQSGSDRILALMKRRYKSSVYSDKIALIKNIIPHACIGTDVIVGFPGENTDEFNETVAFILDQEISYLHAFTYSERANTPAKQFEGIVTMNIRRERNEAIRMISEKKKRHFYSNFIGTSRQVLFEEGKEGDFTFGFTDNYCRVKVPYSHDLINTICTVKLKEITAENEFLGEVLS